MYIKNQAQHTKIISTGLVTFKEIQPVTELKQYIQCFWQMDIKRELETPFTMRMLPGGNTDIFFTIEGSALIHGEKKYSFCKNQAFVLGPPSKGYTLNLPGKISLFGMRIKPGHAFSLLGVPVNEVTNSLIDLQNFWGTSAYNVLDSLLDPLNELSRVEYITNIIRSFHRKNSHSNHLTNGSLNLALKYDKVEKIALHSGYSVRDLQRKFRHHMGISPKLFCRILRFRNSIQLLKGIKNPRWIDIANKAGFFDQSHFINDFKYFTNLSPKNYFTENLKKDVLNFYLPQFYKKH